MRRITLTESARIRLLATAPPDGGGRRSNSSSQSYPNYHHHHTPSHQAAREAERSTHIQEENDHVALVQVNTHSLLQDKLATLRSMRLAIEADNWKFEQGQNNNNANNANVSRQFY